MRTFCKQVVDSYYHTTQHERTERTGQFVEAEHKGLHVDEHAEFRGDRPCQADEDVFKASGRLVLPHQLK